MSQPVLEKDNKIKLPEFRVLKASAGSGKTHALTLRFVQFLISEKIPQNNLRNLTAITFSNNAAREMKERILAWLKAVYLGDNQRSEQLSQLVSLDKNALRCRAGELIEDILENWTEFQVRTIDSFTAAIFTSAAIDLGVPPDFDILLDNSGLMEYAFDFYLRDVKDGSPAGELLSRVINSIHQTKTTNTAYLWDPSEAILNQIKAIHCKAASQGRQIIVEDYKIQLRQIKDQIAAQATKIEDMISESGLVKRKNSSYKSFANIIKNDRFGDLVDKGMANPPVNKPGRDDDKGHDWFNHILDVWGRLKLLVNNYTYYYARIFYVPYLKVYNEFKQTIEQVKKQQSKVFIEDINEKLAQYLVKDIVPDVYLRLGDTIFHYLIDEFQDTSPVQWYNLLPLVENSVSQEGSLFVVGDTKQAIYVFREADYHIMKAVETQNPFPSASHSVSELNKNYRSRQGIIDFNEEVFKNKVVEQGYEMPARESELLFWTQVSEKKDEHKGVVAITILDKDEDKLPERSKVQELITDLRTRGYRYRDIAVLTPRNEDVVRVTTWLNEKEIPFISLSSLDIRRRKITGEIMAVLSFLDSPLDDLSLAVFLLGSIFEKTLQQSRDKNISKINKKDLHVFLFNHHKKEPLYKSFQKEFTPVWEEYLAPLFKSAGYLPLYELVTEIFRSFKIFENLPEEEATLCRILEVIKDFEGEDANSLKSFIRTAEEEPDESRWNMDVPEGTDAVKVMTVHKAKGLGFPVVISLLYNETLHRGFPFIVEESGDKISFLKINEKIAAKNKDYQSLYNKEKVKEEVNSLNKLYVGFTRAEKEMYILGIKGKGDKYPFEILPTDKYPGGTGLKPGKIEKDKPDSNQEESPASIGVYHLAQVDKIKTDTPDIYKPQAFNLEETRRGDLIHAILARIDYLDKDGKLGEDNINSVLDEIVAKTVSCLRDSFDYNKIKNILKGFLKDEQVQEFFTNKPGRTVKKEQEFTNTKGVLFRMDRVIIDETTVTVIDYKTGREPDLDQTNYHQNQLKSYINILKTIYPDKKVTGILAYIDLKQNMKIED